MNKYIQCKCAELGQLDISIEGFKKRLASSIEYERYFRVIETIEAPKQMSLQQCRVCNKYYQASPYGRGMCTAWYLYEVPAIEKIKWADNPYPDPFEDVLKSLDTDYFSY